MTHPRFLALAVGLLAALACLSGGHRPTASAQETAVPAEWAYIPPESMGFVHLRFASQWDSVHLRPLRDHVAKELEIWEQELERTFGTGFSAWDQLTLVLVKMPESFGPGAGAPVKIDVKPATDPQLKPPTEKPDRPCEGIAQEVQPPGQPSPEDYMPSYAVLVTTRKPLERDALLKRLFAAPRENKHQGKVFYTDPKERGSQALAVLGERTYAVGTPSAIRRVLELPGKVEAKGVVAAAMPLAQPENHVIAGFQLTDQVRKSWKGDQERAGDFRGGFQSMMMRTFGPLLEMRIAGLAVQLGKETRIQARVHFPDAARAKDAVGPAQDLLVLTRVFLFGTAHEMVERAIEDADPPETVYRWVLAQLLLQRLETGLRATVVEPRGEVLHATVRVVTEFTALLNEAHRLAMIRQADPALTQARNRRKSVNNLKQIGLAMHNYLSAYNTFPPAALTKDIKDPGGKPLLSWRVAILPFLEEDNLYRQFKLDEPWDSPHNLKLLEQMPKVYAPVGVKTKQPHTTFYQVFSGPGAAFEGTRRIRIADFLDGTSNTILVAEAAEPVPWTKPEDLAYDPKKPLPKLGGMSSGGFGAVFADGAGVFLRGNIDEKTLRALIGRNDGIPVEGWQFIVR